MEGFGERSYQKLCEAIEKARHTTLVRLLYSLGIPGVGLAGAKLLSRHFSGDIHRIMEAEAEELTEIDGIGPILAEGVVTFFRSPKNRQTIEDLLREVELEQEVQEEEQPLSGKVFVITGSLVQFENRNALKEYIERRGGKVTGSVSNKTSYLINNDNTSSSSKNKKAAELGIPILTEEEFLKLEAKQDAVPEEVSDEE